MLGLFLWSAAATVSLFAAFILKRRGVVGGVRDVLRFGGYLSLFLGFDDAFEMHEVVFESLFPMSEKIFYSVYVGSVLAYMILLKDELLKTDFIYWIISMGLFFGSVILDSIDPIVSHQVFYEDCFKFSGIFFWVIYYMRTGFYALIHPEKT